MRMWKSDESSTDLEDWGLSEQEELSLDTPGTAVWSGVWQGGIGEE